MIPQMQDHAGAIGTGATAAGWLASTIAAATPILQFLILLTTLAVGLLTAAWYARKFWRVWKHRKGD